jgi:hypothetical protein
MENRSSPGVFTAEPAEIRPKRSAEFIEITGLMQLWRCRRGKKDKDESLAVGANTTQALIHTRSQLIHSFLTIESRRIGNSRTCVFFEYFQHWSHNMMKIKEKNRGGFVGKFLMACG